MAALGKELLQEDKNGCQRKGMGTFGKEWVPLERNGCEWQGMIA
jgi:hypothetical protein